MAHILHDISGDIRILKSRYYPNISAAVRRWVLLDDAISEGHISCRFSRRCLSAVAVVCCCLLRLSCDFMDIYSFSMSHKVYYVNYSRFIGGFLGWCRRVRALLPLMDRHEKTLPHHPVVPARDSLGSPRHREHQKKITTYPHPHFERVVYPKNIHHIL